MANTYTTTDVENIKKRATELGMNLDPSISTQLDAGAVKTGDTTPSALGLYTAETPEDKAIREAEEKAYNLTQVEQPDEATIKADTLTKFQDEIDALETAATSKKAELARTLGEKATGQLGTQRALLAGSGMLGQGPGNQLFTDIDVAEANAIDTAITNYKSTEKQNAINNMLSFTGRGTTETATPDYSWLGDLGGKITDVLYPEKKETSLIDILKLING